MENIKIKKTVIGKSHLTSGNAYKVKVFNLLTNKGFTFVFNDNYNNDATEGEMLYAVYYDYMVSLMPFDDFMAEYGYDYETGRSIYKMCRLNGAKFSKCMTPEQIQAIGEIGLVY